MTYGAVDLGARLRAVLLGLLLGVLGAAGQLRPDPRGRGVYIGYVNSGVLVSIYGRLAGYILDIFLTFGLLLGDLGLTTSLVEIVANPTGGSEADQEGYSCFRHR